MKLKDKLNNKVIPVNKSTGITTFDCVRKFKSFSKIKKAGHAGSLDPVAEGLVLLLSGEATKLSDYLMDLPKKYTADIRLGQSTDTQDTMGEIVSTGEWKGIGKEEIKDVLPEFLGKRLQVPPMYSALKYKGTPLYKLARKGKKVERKPREVRTHEIDLVSCNLPDFKIRVKCSRGLYIRTLAEEIGKRLGVPSHLSGLRRDAIGNFNVEEAVSPDAFNMLDEIESPGYSPAEALAHLPAVEMSKRQSALLLNGVAPPFPIDMDLSRGDIIRLIRFDNTLGGIGEVTRARIIKIRRVLKPASRY
ncbi:MAG TPA: tRNA pseudouridine(55) synthase TruB [Candidatus Krumholzibacteriaceae bacterium]|nr:tRNA pseudouridine(55) synthase TruB [Candidatus Krumholzibacteriaceae bacterium]